MLIKKYFSHVSAGIKKARITKSQLLAQSLLWFPLKKFYNIETSSWCYKTIFGGNLDFPKLRNWKTFIMISEPALKCENNAIYCF